MASLYVLECHEFINSLSRNLEVINFKHNSSLPSVDERIRAELQPFFTKWEVREDLIIQETPELPHSKGVNCFTNRGDAVVFTLNNLCSIDKDACMFTIKREIHNIKSNGNMELCYPITCILSLIYPLFRHVSFTLRLSSSYVEWPESIDDIYAMRRSSIEELKGGRRFLIAIKQYKNEIKDKKSLHYIFKNWYSYSIENVMESIYDAIISTSMLDSRIQQIEMNLKKRNGRIDEKVESKKIKLIKKLIENNLNHNSK